MATSYLEGNHEARIENAVCEWDENGNKALEIQYKDGVEVSRKEF